MASQLPLSYRPGGFAHKRKKLMFAISYETSQGVWHRDGYMTEMAFSLLWSKLKGEEEKGDSLFFLQGPLPTGMPTLPHLPLDIISACT